eukprot:1189993-Pleurochrysis_carterae.AAC.3
MQNPRCRVEHFDQSRRQTDGEALGRDALARARLIFLAAFVALVATVVAVVVEAGGGCVVVRKLVAFASRHKVRAVHKGKKARGAADRLRLLHQAVEEGAHRAAPQVDAHVGVSRVARTSPRETARRIAKLCGRLAVGHRAERHADVARAVLQSVHA